MPTDTRGQDDYTWIRYVPVWYGDTTVTFAYTSPTNASTFSDIHISELYEWAKTATWSTESECKRRTKLGNEVD